MIEYLLILTLTVAVILAVSKGVGKPLQEYMQRNVLDLVGCMLRVGQFPTKSFGLCQNAIQIQMDVEGAYDNTGSGAGDSTGNANSSSTNDNNSNENGNSDTNGSGNDTSDQGDDAGNRTRVRSNTGTGSLNDTGNDSAFGNGPTKRIRISNDDSTAGDKEISTGSENGPNFGETTVIVRRIKREDGRVGGSFYVEGDERAGDEAQGPESYQAVTSQQNPRSEFDRQPSGRRFAIKQPTDNAVKGATKDEDVDFSFLGMIKWIIIIGVLLFIIIFAASQLNSIRKGWTD